MKIAIYSRKSKFTGKGESIENQISLCKQYAFSHFECSEEDIYIYEDEGFSGGNLDRPQFKKLITDIKAKKVDTLICYRLDRISRNVSDFSGTMEMLNKYSVSFVSIKEQFDTSSPMGRAMTYISSVFAQLERETIAERIRDNMLELAKTGRWLGGITPTGYESEEVVSHTTGKARKLFKLKVVDAEAELINLIFNKFLEFKSLTKLETYLIQNNIKTKNNKNYRVSALKLILINPVYVQATTSVYDYLINKGCSLCVEKEKFDGSKAIMVYNRTNQTNKSSEKRDAGEWIIALGEHAPIVKSVAWLKAQEIIDKNKDKAIRRVRSQETLLSGLLRCEHCGSYMRPKRSRISADGSRYHFYYICELKEKSLSKRCSIKNITGYDLDTAIMEQLMSFASGNSKLNEEIMNDKELLHFEIINRDAEVNKIQSEIENSELAISNLMENLTSSNNVVANKYILSKIESLGIDIENMKFKIETLENQKKEISMREMNFDLMQHSLTNLKQNIGKATTEEKRELIRSIIESITWDGTEIKVNVFGANALKKP
jgi:site-specific DNA recombinase